jgi:predicted CoA-binding protein
VNPNCPEIEGIKTQPLVDALAAANPKKTGLSVITPPVATLAAVDKALQSGLTNIWLQPGAEDDKVLAVAKQHSLLLHSGPCVLVELGVGDHE